MIIYWNSSVDVFNVTHPLDPTGGGSGPLSIGDIYFIGNSSEFKLYSFGGYKADRTDHNPPLVIVSEIEFDDGYPYWTEWHFSLGFIGYKIEGVLGKDGTYALATYPNLNNWFKKTIQDSPCFYFLGQETSSYPSSASTFDLDTTTETDWDYDTGGNTPVYSATAVSPESTSAYSYNLELEGTLAISSSYYQGTTLVEVIPGARGDNLYYWIISRAGTGPYTFYLDCIKLSSLSSSATISAAATGITIGSQPDSTSARNRVGGWNEELLITSLPYYTGSKPNQGRIIVCSLNAAKDTLSLDATIDTPVPARYGYMGINLAVARVTDSVDGQTTHIIAGGSDDTDVIRVFAQEDSWAQQTSWDLLARNDIVVNYSASEDLALVYMVDDSASGRHLFTYTYSGTAWSQDTSQAHTTSYYNFICLSNGYIVGTDALGTPYGASLYDETFTSVDTCNISRVGFDLEVVGRSDDIIFNDSVNDLFQIIRADTTLDTIEVLGATGTGDWPTFSDNLTFFETGTPANDRVVGEYYSSPSYVLEFWERVIEATYELGNTTIFPDTDDARFIPVDADNTITSVSLTATGTTDLYWAASFDKGVTWEYYNGSIWQTINPFTTDLVTSVSLLSSYLATLDDVVSLDLCFQWQVDAGSPAYMDLEKVTINWQGLSSPTIEYRPYSTTPGVQGLVRAAVVDPDYEVEIDLYTGVYYVVNIAYFDNLV